jgi:hypothetical protein
MLFASGMNSVFSVNHSIIAYLKATDGHSSGIDGEIPVVAAEGGDPF